MRQCGYFLVNVIVLLFMANFTFAADWTIDVTVAKDGSGDYTTITDAINSNPNDGSNYVIFIKNGIYDEKLFISKNNLTLIGEDRDNTIYNSSDIKKTLA